MRRITVISFVSVAFLAPTMVGVAQAPQLQKLTFDAASVKPHTESGYYRVSFPPGGGFSASLPVEWLIGVAYDIRPLDRIIGEPAWARTQWFNVEAKPATTVSRAETLAMLQTLLEDRFGLVYRKDPNGQATVYALTMAREDKQLGPGVRPAQSECLKNMAPVPPIAERRLRPGVPVPCGTSNAGEVFTGGSVPISLLALNIQLALGEEVVNRTGLTGNVDFYVTLPRAGNPATQDPAAVSIFTAIQEQLGMRLQRETVQRDAFIVERLSQPTPN